MGMTDREKVVKGLECCRECTKDDLSHSDEPCEECPYLVNGNACSPWELFDDALALLKEQPEIVRCKDCKKKGISYLCILDRDLQEYGGDRTDEYDDWFCADGERR